MITRSNERVPNHYELLILPCLTLVSLILLYIIYVCYQMRLGFLATRVMLRLETGTRELNAK